jgi:hypothetical protein
MGQALLHGLNKLTDPYWVDRLVDIPVALEGTGHNYSIRH